MADDADQHALPPGHNAPKMLFTSEELDTFSGPLGVRAKHETCIRCGKLCDEAHRVAWLECEAKCVLCRSKRHVGAVCSRMQLHHANYFTAEWWTEHACLRGKLPWTPEGRAEYERVRDGYAERAGKKKSETTKSSSAKGRHDDGRDKKRHSHEHRSKRRKESSSEDSDDSDYHSRKSKSKSRKADSSKSRDRRLKKKSKSERRHRRSYSTSSYSSSSSSSWSSSSEYEPQPAGGKRKRAHGSKDKSDDKPNDLAAAFAARPTLSAKGIMQKLLLKKKMANQSKVAGEPGIKVEQPDEGVLANAEQLRAELQQERARCIVLEGMVTSLQQKLRVAEGSAVVHAAEPDAARTALAMATGAAPSQAHSQSISQNANEPGIFIKMEETDDAEGEIKIP